MPAGIGYPPRLPTIQPFQRPPLPGQANPAARPPLPTSGGFPGQGAPLAGAFPGQGAPVVGSFPGQGVAGGFPGPGFPGQGAPVAGQFPGFRPDVAGGFPGQGAPVAGGFPGGQPLLALPSFASGAQQLPSAVPQDVQQRFLEMLRARALALQGQGRPFGA